MSFINFTPKESTCFAELMSFPTSTAFLMVEKFLQYRCSGQALQKHRGYWVFGHKGEHLVEQRAILINTKLTLDRTLGHDSPESCMIVIDGVKGLLKIF